MRVRGTRGGLGVWPDAAWERRGGRLISIALSRDIFWDEA